MFERALALALVVPLMLSFLVVASAQIPLQADLQHAVVLAGSKYLFKNTGGEDRVLFFYVDPNDVSRMPGETLFIVVETGQVDTYAGVAPRLRVCVQPIEYRPPVWCSDWLDARPDSKLEFAVPKRYLLGYYERASRAYVELASWRLPKGDDTSYGVMVKRVLLAPSASATITTKTATVHRVLAADAASSADSSKDGTKLVLWAVGFAAVFAIVAFVVGLLFGKRRVFALLPLLLVLPPLLAPVAAHAQTPEIQLSGSGQVTIPVNTTIVFRPMEGKIVVLMFNETLSVKLVNSTGGTVVLSTNNVTLGKTFVAAEINTTGLSQPLVVAYAEIPRIVPLANEWLVFSGEVSKEKTYVVVSGLEPGKRYKVVVEDVDDGYLRYIAIWDGEVNPSGAWWRSPNSYGKTLVFETVAGKGSYVVTPSSSSITVGISTGWGRWRVYVYALDSGGGSGGGSNGGGSSTVTITRTSTVTQTVVQQVQNQQLSGNNMDTKTLLYLVGGAIALIFLVLLVIVIIVLGKGR